MAHRNVIKHGPSTLIVSLPSKWVKCNNVKSGDILEFLEDGDSLVFSLKKIVKSKKHIDVDFSSLDRSSVMFFLRSLYRQGYNSIRISFKNSQIPYFRTGDNINILNVIKQEIDRLPGFEIIEQRPNHCMVQEITETSSSEFDSVFKKIFFMMDDAFEGIIECIKNSDFSFIEAFDEKHNSITKFISYCCRLLMMEKIKGYQANLHFYNILTGFDVIADFLKNFCREVVRQKILPFNKKGIEVIQTLANMQKLFYNIFFNFKKDYLINFEKNKELLLKLICDRNIPNQQKSALFYLWAISDIQRDIIGSRLIIKKK